MGNDREVNVQIFSFREVPLIKDLLPGNSWNICSDLISFKDLRTA